ncbi:hypothetical protein LI012_13960 [Caldibacillus thermoamylovorans]|jgi:hypothetical protein|uniref:hypothetical protein n=1 Tax=Bacillaceae TaxID=186817 RepID=UPI000BA2FA19|nr:MULTISPECIES: hypothetical protein [Bacillaceae]MCB5936481.1 hypothetical protein [Bacillus sp. DFI.2.34]MBU5342222.1 hypothetical protein [Caldifermentibacillus hisashii]MCB7077916.1 hypothetical protein [Caldibacillus thermoamylovorans]MEC5271905.1 hypothetical protein [Caldifermentibacillus hisashii]PAC35119.1 hypothetical protein CEJ87_11135 [Caldifermentibacillus hisashii]
MKTIVKNLFLPFSTAKRSYKLLVIMVILVPILFGTYILLSLVGEGLTFSEYLYQNVWNNIQFLVALVDLAWAYILITIYPDFETGDDQEYIGFTLWILLISQLVVTNLLLAAITGITLYRMNLRLRHVLQMNIMFRYKHLTILSASLLLFSLLCGFALFRISFS